MSKKQTPAEVVISKFGSVRQASINLNVSRITVMHWRKTGFIPAWRQQEIKNILGNRITYKQLVVGN